MKRHPKSEGIVVQCVSCHEKKTISFDEASNMTDMPMCERCFMPMVTVGAFVKPHQRRSPK
jgi:hypothetical protein